jgi:hypothetical protein
MYLKIYAQVINFKEKLQISVKNNNTNLGE